MKFINCKKLIYYPNLKTVSGDSSFNPANKSICCEHFIGQKPSKMTEHPGYVPSIIKRDDTFDVEAEKRALQR